MAERGERLSDRILSNVKNHAEVSSRGTVMTVMRETLLSMAEEIEARRSAEREAARGVVLRREEARLAHDYLPSGQLTYVRYENRARLEALRARLRAALEAGA